MRFLLLLPYLSQGFQSLKSHYPKLERKALVYDYVEAFVDELASYEKYVDLDSTMNAMRTRVNCQGRWPTAAEAAALKCPPLDFKSNDLAAQLICGAGWRVLTEKENTDERSVVIAAPGNKGARFVITTPKQKKSRAARFLERTGRQGIGALAFRLDSKTELDALRAAYENHHPALLIDHTSNDLEAYAYYHSSQEQADTDRARLRYSCTNNPFPSHTEVKPWSMRAVSDHWVSNVADRELFLKTLGDVAGLSPRVEFDAGVIAAGKASIESTVLAGGSIFLPANNALSPHGHVAAFLEEMGQGVQHLATRVDDLVAFVATAKALREVTGIGFNFLDVPRAYYGYLDSAQRLATRAQSNLSQAEFVLQTARDLDIIDKDGIVDLDADEKKLLNAVGNDLQHIVDALLFFRYSNIYKVLGDRLQPKEYIEIVRNRILVDKQGDDALLQIFTTNILQRDSSQEAPFLEFIQRVCDVDSNKDQSLDPPRFGCGGFGIRNFLTLFLSIELNSALTAFRDADTPTAKDIAQRRLDCLTEQLDASSEVLATIADASALEAKLIASSPSSSSSHTENNAELENAKQRKAEAQAQLQIISRKYATRMSDIDSFAAAAAAAAAEVEEVEEVDDDEKQTAASLTSSSG